jgi:hypothetical protein
MKFLVNVLRRITGRSQLARLRKELLEFRQRCNIAENDLASANRQVTSARRRVEELEKTLSRIHAPEILQMDLDAGKWVAEISHPFGPKLLACAFADTLNHFSAENYVECVFEHPTVGKILVTVQKAIFMNRIVSIKEMGPQPEDVEVQVLPNGMVLLNPTPEEKQLIELYNIQFLAKPESISSRGDDTLAND